MIWVIGNGESRIGLDLNKIYPKIGCNAIYRDYNVDHLICVDRRMVKEALAKKVNSVIYTRKDWFRSFPYPLMPVPDLPYTSDARPDQPIHWGSGPYAVLVATTMDETIGLIGFDLYSKTKTINNVYKDTENYDKKEKNPIDPRYWIHQIGKVFESYPRKKFIVYQETSWNLPKQWNHPNVSLDKYDNIK